MCHITHLRKQFKSIKTNNYIIKLIRRKNKRPTGLTVTRVSETLHLSEGRMVCLINEKKIIKEIIQFHYNVYDLRDHTLAKEPLPRGP